MFIECPFCHARARISEAKEGAKVRCGECERVYRARDASAAGQAGRASSGGQSGPWIAIVTVAVLAIGALMVMKQGGGADDDVRAAVAEVEPEEAPEPEPYVDPTGWESEPVQAAVRLHEAAAAADRDAVRAGLDGPFLAALAAGDAPAADEPPAEGLGEPPGQDAWDALEADARDALLEATADAMLGVDEESTVVAWTPYDGEVKEEDGDRVLVHVYATPAAGGAEERTIEWRLVRRDGEWLAYAFARWLTPAERARIERGYDLTELTDGRVVREREPEPLEHLEDTSDELRDRIDTLIDTMLDLDLTTQSTNARTELIEIGRPAIPILLTHLYENKLYGREDAIQANLAVTALREITGEHFGYQPQVLSSGALGTTEELRQSSIKQWFAWWYRNQDTFVARPEPETDDENDGE